MAEEHLCGDNCSHGEADMDYFRQQIVQQQVAEIESQLTQIESHRIELNTLLESVEELKGKKDVEVMLPIGAGLLTRCKLIDGNSFLVNVGAGVMVMKSAEEAKKVIEKQFEELDRARALFEDELKKLSF